MDDQAWRAVRSVITSGRTTWPWSDSEGLGSQLELADQSDDVVTGAARPEGDAVAFDGVQPALVLWTYGPDLPVHAGTLIGHVLLDHVCRNDQGMHVLTWPCPVRNGPSVPVQHNAQTQRGIAL